MKYYLTLFIVCCIVAIPVNHIFNNWSPNEDFAKEYIMEHRTEIKKTNAVYFKLDTIKRTYYTDATIELKPDSTYHVIFWGNHNSLLWPFKKDLNFTIDIPYQRFKGNDVSNDVIIYRILKNK